MFGLGQHIASATDAYELPFLHKPADLLRMDRQPGKVPGLQNGLRSGRSGPAGYVELTLFPRGSAQPVIRL
jgi:hypothetical protein